MRLLGVILALLIALILASCGSEEGGGGQTIAIGETEYALDPSSVQVDETGTVTFTATNNGTIEHAFEVEGQGVEEETELIQPGESAELTVDLSQAGTYEIYCPVDGHREMGMEGTLTVGGGGGGAGTTTTEETTTSGGGGYGSG